MSHPPDTSTPGHSATWESQSRLVRTLTVAAAMIALVVALAGPLGYFLLSCQAISKEVTMAARLHAVFVSQVASNSDDWASQVEGLIDADLVPSDLPEFRAIRDAGGTLIARAGLVLAGKTVITGTAVVMGRGGAVGTMEVIRSFRPVLLRTAVFAFFAAALGLAIYVTLKVLPLRALQRTLDALQREEAHARKDAEERLRIVFEHSIDGIIILASTGVIVSCNPAASKMLCELPQALTGRRLTNLLGPIKQQQPLGTVDVGHSETVLRRNDGSEFPVEITVNETFLTGTQQMIVTIRDITERKESQDRLADLANYDSLTGLPNRILFRDRLMQAMERARRSGQPLSLMFLDLDRFKVVNDSLGHAVGDLLLIHVAEQLSQCLRTSDTVARHGSNDSAWTVSRLGGDEFTLVVEEGCHAGQAALIAQRILDALAAPFVHAGQEIYISASIGISVYPDDDVDLDGLIRHADLAMYRSKEIGRNTYNFYRNDMNANVAARLALEGDLRHALERNEFLLHYQPKADLDTGVITGVEALIRWNRPGQGMVPPGDFVGALEDTGMIVPVGAWVIQTACAQLAAWGRMGMAPFSIAVNLSARQFRQKDLAEMIADAVRDNGLTPDRLELELTESMLMQDNEISQAVLASFTRLGFRVAIDDFGTGHSSLSYLKRFNVHTLKIDRSFVSDIPDNLEDCVIAQAIIALAHSLKLKVVAEGVETLAQMAFLRDLGCDEMQGYLLSRPLPAEQILKFLPRSSETEDEGVAALVSSAA